MRPPIPDHQHLIAHQVAAPPPSEPYDEPRPARCTARTYGGDVVTLGGVVIARARGILAFRADYPGWGEWTAWVEQDCCEPI